MARRSYLGHITRSRNSPVGIDPITGKEGYTEAGRRASADRFWKEIPAELPAPERQARYEAARKAYFGQLAAKRWSKSNAR